ncbi:DDE-type integrase/transposase/recombinase [Glaciecola sp. 1036]|uniref:DDE-type integrase/transposase/recombinase n=1 Tax=Alteromonadaceae TaxID=72275 RepID=UPI003CFFE3E6
MGSDIIYDLWRVVDQDGDVIDIFIQEKRDCKAAKRLFKRLIDVNEALPRKIVTYKLPSYPLIRKVLMPSSIHYKSLYANNKAELSYQSTRIRDRVMWIFNSIKQGQ